jgi:hypothetical protein
MTSELDLLTNNGWKLNDSLDNAVRQTAKLVADVPADDLGPMIAPATVIKGCISTGAAWAGVAFTHRRCI